MLSWDGCTYGGQFDIQWKGGINDSILDSCYSGGTCCGGSGRNGGCSSWGVVYRSGSGDCDRLRSGDCVRLGGGARPGVGHWDLFSSGGGDGLEILGSGSADGLGWGRCEAVRGDGLGGGGDEPKSRLLSSGVDRLGSTCGDGLKGDGGHGLGPGSGGRLRLDGSGQLGGCELGCGSDHLGCDGSDRLGCNGSGRLECNGSNQLGWGSDNQIGCDGLNWAGDGLKDGGGPVGHRSRLDDRASDGGWTKVYREAGKGVGSRVVQGDEKGSVLLARVVFDKDNPLNWSNTLHGVVMLRE